MLDAIRRWSRLVMDPDESLTHKKLADQLEKWGDIGRRSPHLPADGETYLVEEAPDFIQRLAELEVKRLPDIAILPRNFYTAPSAEAFVFERETNDVRVIARQGGTVADPLSESASILHENDAVTIGVVIAISVQLLGAVNSSATLIEFFQRLGGFLARKVSRVSDPSV